MKNKRGFEFSFGWMFAIIVGAVIIFLAIYAASKFVKTAKDVQQTELGKQLGIILSPIETNLETGKISKILLPYETRLFNECKISGTFGVQKISTVTKSEIGDEWGEQGEASSFRNKYIFSRDLVEGEHYFVFSKPLEMPFKIADLVYIWAGNDKYCFINPPNVIEDEVSELDIENVNISSSISGCPKGVKIVCFTSSGCDIDISLDASGKIKGTLKKRSEARVYFETSSLLYSAIFADSDIYECQIKRLMNRASELSGLYYSKSRFLSPRGCNSNLDADLIVYANKTLNLKSSLELRDIYAGSEEIRRKNEELLCKLF